MDSPFGPDWCAEEPSSTKRSPQEYNSVPRERYASVYEDRQEVIFRDVQKVRGEDPAIVADPSILVSLEEMF